MKTKEEIAELAKKIVSSGMADKVLNKYDGKSKSSQRMRRPLFNPVRIANRVPGDGFFSGGTRGPLDAAWKYLTNGDTAVIDRLNNIVDSSDGKYDPRIESGLMHEDAKRIYLGLPQLYGTLEPTAFRPTIGSSENPYQVNPLMTDEQFENAILPMWGVWKTGADWPVYGTEGRVKDLGRTAQLSDFPFLNNAGLSIGMDENGQYLSLFDTWDYNTSVKGKHGDNIARLVGGKPFDIYNRYYLDGWLDVPEEHRGHPYIAPSYIEADYTGPGAAQESKKSVEINPDMLVGSMGIAFKRGGGLHRYDGESEDSQQMRRYYTGLLDYMPIVPIPAEEYGSSGTSDIQVVPDVRSIRRSAPEDSLGTSILEKEYERIANEQGTQAAQEYARRQGAIGAGAAVGSALAGGLAAEGALTSAVTGGLDYLRPSKIPEMVYHAFRPGASGLLKAMPYYSGATTLGGALADTALDSYFAVEGGRNLGKTGSVPGEILNAMNFVPLIAPVYNAGRLAYNAGKRAYNYGKEWWDIVARGNMTPYEDAAGRMLDSKQRVTDLLGEFNGDKSPKTINLTAVGRPGIKPHLRERADSGEMLDVFLPLWKKGIMATGEGGGSGSPKTFSETTPFMMPDGTVADVPLNTRDIGYVSDDPEKFLIEYWMPGKHPAAKAGDYEAIDPDDIYDVQLKFKRNREYNPGLSDRGGDVRLESLDVTVPYAGDIPTGSLENAPVRARSTTDALNMDWQRGERVSADRSRSLLVQAGATDKEAQAVIKQVGEVRNRLQNSGEVTGSSLLYESGILSGTPHDTEIATTRSRLEAAKKAMDASDPVNTGKVALEGSSDYAANKRVDWQVIEENSVGEATGKLAWEYFRTMHPLEAEEQARRSLNTSEHYTDMPIINPATGRTYTPDELFDEFQGGGYALQNVVNDALSIMKDVRQGDKATQLKHNRPMAILTNENPEVKALTRKAIDTIGQSQLGLDYHNGSEVFEFLDFGNVEENKKLLKHLGLNTKFADDEDMMKNIFDYYYLQQSVQKRGVAGAADERQVLAWTGSSNFPRGGGDFSGAGRNTVSSTAQMMPFSYPQVGTTQVHLTTHPEDVNTMSDFLNVLKRTGENYKHTADEITNARDLVSSLEKSGYLRHDLAERVGKVLGNDEMTTGEVSDGLRRLVKKAVYEGLPEEEIEMMVEAVATGLDLPFIRTSGYGGDYRGVLTRRSAASSARYFDFGASPNPNIKPYEYGRPIEQYASDVNGGYNSYLSPEEAKTHIPAEDLAIRDEVQRKIMPAMLFGQEDGVPLSELKDYDVRVKDYRPEIKTLLRDMLDADQDYREAKAEMDRINRMPGFGWRRGREMKKQTKALEEFLKDTSKRRSVELGLGSVKEYNELTKWMPDDIDPEDIVSVQKRPSGGYYVETKSKKGGRNDGWFVQDGGIDPETGELIGFRWEYDLPFANGGLLRRFDTGGAVPISPAGQYSPLPLYPFALPDYSVIGPAAVPVIDARKDAARRIRAVENSKKNPNGGWNEKEQRWYPHSSYEGGADTIAYGIKLSNGSPEAKLALKQGYLTDEQANSAVDTLVDKYYNDAQKVYDTKYGAGEWDKLSDWSQSILTDYSYNPGLAKFPSLMDGFHSGDMDKILANYKRYSGDKPLGRNKILLSEIQQLNDVYPIFRADGGKIHIKPENRGKFTALKKRTGHSASWFKAHGTPSQRKMATFALNARKWKHADGGILERLDSAYNGDTSAMLEMIQRIKDKRNG